MWNGDQANQHTGRRNYADGAGASTLEGMGYRFACLLDLQLHVCGVQVILNVFFNRVPAVVKVAQCPGEAVKRRPSRQGKVKRAGVSWKPKFHLRTWKETRRLCSG